MTDQLIDLCIVGIVAISLWISGFRQQFTSEISSEQVENLPLVLRIFCGHKQRKLFDLNATVIQIYALLLFVSQAIAILSPNYLQFKSLFLVFIVVGNLFVAFIALIVIRVYYRVR